MFHYCSFVHLTTLVSVLVSLSYGLTLINIPAFYSILLLSSPFGRFTDEAALISRHCRTCASLRLDSLYWHPCRGADSRRAGWETRNRHQHTVVCCDNIVLYKRKVSPFPALEREQKLIQRGILVASGCLVIDQSALNCCIRPECNIFTARRYVGLCA